MKPANWRRILTVGGVVKACHGNEPGTLKEVVSLNTGGPCFPIIGAPIVICELGMISITGSIGQMNSHHRSEATRLQRLGDYE